MKIRSHSRRQKHSLLWILLEHQTIDDSLHSEVKCLNTLIILRVVSCGRRRFILSEERSKGHGARKRTNLILRNSDSQVLKTKQAYLKWLLWLQFTITLSAFLLQDKMKMAKARYNITQINSIIGWACKIRMTMITISEREQKGLNLDFQRLNLFQK